VVELCGFLYMHPKNSDCADKLSSFEIAANMKKYLSLIILPAVLAALAFSQKPNTVSQPLRAEAEPFRISPGSSFAASTAKQVPTSPTAAKLLVSDIEVAMQVIREHHVGGAVIDEASLAKSSLTSMLHSLDPHSSYYDPAEYLELLGGHQNEYSGTGSVISTFEKDGKLETYVVSTFPGSPASHSNLRFGDRIVAVDGASISGESSETVRDRVRGKSGTFVNLTIEHVGSKAVETIELRRDSVPQPSVPAAYIIGRGFGYINLTTGFSHSTAAELGTAIKELRQQGAKSLILDLRGNGGGILEQAIKTAEHFLPAGELIVTQRGRSANDNLVWKSENKTAELMPLAVLVDEESASASEVVAGALQDHDRALIVGERTFGKGLVQSVLNLPLGSGLTLTTGKYFTPSGRSIQRDYSDGSLYNYFNHMNETAASEKLRLAARTDSRRKVYGGSGITPEEILKKQPLTSVQISLLDPIFFFSREVVSGCVKGFKRYKIACRNKSAYPANTSQFDASGELLESFKHYAHIEWGYPEPLLKSQSEYIKLRLHYTFVLAAFGRFEAERVMMENDPQVLKAIEVLPKSAALAKAAGENIRTSK